MGDDADADRDRLQTLEDGLCDLQILAVEAKLETTSASEDGYPGCAGSYGVQAVFRRLIARF